MSEKKSFKETEENHEKNCKKIVKNCSNCFRPIDNKKCLKEHFPSRKTMININLKLDLNLNLVVILVAIILLR